MYADAAAIAQYGAADPAALQAAAAAAAAAVAVAAGGPAYDDPAAVMGTPGGDIQTPGGSGPGSDQPAKRTTKKKSKGVSIISNSSGAVNDIDQKLS